MVAMVLVMRIMPQFHWELANVPWIMIKGVLGASWQAKIGRVGSGDHAQLTLLVILIAERVKAYLKVMMKLKMNTTLRMEQALWLHVA